jgi:multidrug efflux pump subunit AcrA (membrane-fusion protein)
VKSETTVRFAKQLVQPSGTVRWFGYILFMLAALVIIALVYIPWVQTVNAKGRVTALSPSERPQYIDAQISGRLVEWRVKEGQKLQVGDTIAIIQDVDPKFLDPELIDNTQQQLTATEDRARSAMQQIDAFKRQVSAEQEARSSGVRVAQEAFKQATQRRIALEAQFELELQNLEIAQQRFKDRKDLYEKGLRSVREFEQAKLALQEAETKVERSKADVAGSKNAELQAEANVKNKMAEGDSKILKSLADESKAIETMSSITSSIAKARSDVNAIIQRRGAGVVIAPVDCRIVRLYSLGKGEVIKQGDILAMISPVTTSLAVELFVSGNDAPLIRPGSHVRIQFDGFPALQVSGWPQVNVGTYGGVVQVIDAVDDDKARGMFRVIVKPDVSRNDDPWPSQEYLRPGAMVSSWMQLNTVSIGYELWRQFNGFPPSIEKPSDLRQTNKTSKDTEGEKKSND